MSQAVFASYDQAALDAQYNNRARVSDYQTYLEKWAAQSAEVRQKSKAARIDVAFGSTAAEKLDIFPADAPNAPACMFIHGGYWFSLDKRNFSVIAGSLVPNGVTCVVNN
ncbi:MAG: alpha/beta hydrolase, partial [Aestuariivirgaceae bacterium]